MCVCENPARPACSCSSDALPSSTTSVPIDKLKCPETDARPIQKSLGRSLPVLGQPSLSVNAGFLKVELKAHYKAST